MDKQEFIFRIGEHAASPGPYTHNIVSLYLRELAKEYGQEAANEVIRIFDLTEVFGISESPDDEKGD
jgi:hypothetical protein